jgi:hypothetical protein
LDFSWEARQSFFHKLSLLEMEKKKRSSDSMSSLSSSVPEDLAAPETPAIIPAKRRANLTEKFEGLANTLQELAKESDWSTKDLLGRIRFLREENTDLKQRMAQMENRLKACELKLSKQFVAASTLAPASASGPASKPPALKRAETTVSPQAPGSTAPMKKVDIPTITDWDAPFCSKCNEDHPQCV